MLLLLTETGRNFENILPGTLGISIAGTIVPLPYDIKTFRVTIDTHLTLNSNISTVCKFAAYRTRGLRHIRKFLTHDMAKAVAN